MQWLWRNLKSAWQLMAWRHNQLACSHNQWHQPNRQLAASEYQPNGSKQYGSRQLAMAAIVAA
jgi:hypothetical protein